jgi:hypothetical protein
MAKHLGSTKDNKSRSKAVKQPAWKFEVIHEEPSPLVGAWSKLRENLDVLVTAGSGILGEAYVSVARVVLERTEQLEDLRAERKARHRIAARTVRRANSASELQAIKNGARHANGLASDSNSNG